MEKNTPRELILKTLEEKSVLKQNVHRQTVGVFEMFKSVLKEVATDLSQKMAAVDKRVLIEFKDTGEFELEMRVAGDILIFYMHTNVFEFDRSHSIWKTSYVRDNEFNSYCGMINVYNFLTDSFKYNRVNDIGYLIARIFINRENHFFVEGKRQLGFLYNDFVHSVIDREKVTAIVESLILYCLAFDLFTPPFDAVKEVTVMELQEATSQMQVTGKRLGFRFQADSDKIE
jgi:hypothetical protein